MAVPDRISADVNMRFFSRCLRTLSLALATLGCLPLISEPLFAQRYPILPVPNSPENIYSMMQDSRSRIWMGTLDDVLCFDGVRFYSIRQYGFPKETPNAFAEDSENGIWIGTQGTDYKGGRSQGGLYRYKAGRVEKISTGDVLSLASPVAGAMLVSFGTELNGRPTYGDLYLFREFKGAWKPQLLLPKSAHHLTIDHHGTTLFPCPDGWCELSQQQIAQPGSELNVIRHRGEPSVERVLRDRFDCVWFRAEKDASYQCPGAPSITYVPDEISKYDSSAHLEEAPDGSILLLVNFALGRPGSFHTAQVKNGMPAKMGDAIVAKDGTIWISAVGGLYRFMYPFQLEYWNQNDGVERPYSLNRFGGQILATGSGIVTLSMDRSKWVTLPGTEKLDGPGSLTPGPKRTFFASTWKGTVQIREDGKILRSGPSVLLGGMASNAQGQVWVGGWFDNKGLGRLVAQGDRLVIQPENVPENSVLGLKYDNQRHTLWACDGKELLYRKENEEWRHISQKDGLLDFNCHYVALQRDGNLWMSYDSSPFAHIENPMSGHPTITNYPINLEQQGNNTVLLDVDNRGWIWRGTTENYVADPKAAEAGNWLRLDEQDGLPAVNDGAFFNDTDGSIWMGAGSQIRHFTPPADFATSFPAPSLFVSGFSIGNALPVLADAFGAVAHGSDLTAHVGSLQFDRRNALRLRWRLLPDQPAWHSTTDLDLHLGRLSWGQHTLEFQAQLMDGPWSDLSSKTFRVLRPVWLSWPAIFGFLLVSGGGAALVHRRQRILKKRNETSLPSLAEWRLAALSPELQQLDGAVLDSRFKVGRVLARGGFATVAEGRDLQQNNLPCAVKIFRQELLDNDWMARRFRQEVQALETIRHPNVVSIYGHGATPSGSPYLVMEFVRGLTLRERIDKGPIPSQLTANYLRQAGSALAAIHAHGICHRDLKPENLMIRDNRPRGEDLVLIDFSIAIVQDPDQTLHGLSRAAGTIYYMAPEQSIGYADSSTDIYSLAKVLIEMLTGQRLTTLLPDASMDLSERVRDLITGLGLGLSANSIDLISSALEFDPSRRPKSSTEFAQPIAAELEALPLAVEESLEK